MTDTLVGNVGTETEGQGEHILHVPDATGDSRFNWDVRDRNSVAVAKAAFEDGKRRGMAAFAIDPLSGEKTGTQIREFDETKGQIVMVAPLQGG